MKEILDRKYEPDDFGARYYNPALGRWMNPDPLADMYQGWSAYNYVLNNPLGFIDPTGAAAECIGWDDAGYCAHYLTRSK